MINRIVYAAFWVLLASILVILLGMGIAWGAHPILMIPYLAFVVFVVALGLEVSRD